MKYLKISLIALLLTGCTSQGIHLDLDWHIPSTAAQGLVPSGPQASIIPFSSPAIEQFGCLNADDIAELKEALRRANIGRANFRKVAVALEMQNPDQVALDADAAFEDIERNLTMILQDIRNGK